ncbi:protein kinase domain-containing protein [Antrihabitans stalactiti]|uniref:non-specific serine/threonine protein kinase n=1 Tax=Antrihabitans stalactiti TaxID=2584121 RepID=A0A848KPB3_9NOCA|nr:protein kinase [Antrihabitans stalactiti]NMN97467.1 FHA domain-containing protein [Antrihabitans stalactiti]
MSKVTLTVIAGPSTGATFEYTERTIAIAGRADDCNPRIIEPGPQVHVSRHHCLFDINPPDIRVRDFGSLNGTHVNGVEIGRRAAGQTPEEGARNAFRERDLVDGDRIALGATILAVTVESDRETVVTPTRRVSPRFEPGSRIDKLLSDAAAGQPDLAGIRGFEIVSELGRGGQGVVYLARHESNGELVALKVLLAAIAVQRKARDEFLREISGMRALRHPNVVGLREAGSAGDTFFFTSEFCPGGSVDDLVRKGGVLNPEEAVAITLQALDGLAYTHSVLLGPEATGLVHRDIKPGNILLSSTGPDRIAKIGDFGLAKAFDRAGLSGHTMTGAIAGTLSFMAYPQLIDYKRAKPDVDVWSTAATLYWMLTQKMPRNFPPAADPIGVVLGTSAIPIRERNPAIPGTLAAVIDEALIDKPQIVVTSATEFADALRNAL